MWNEKMLQFQSEFISCTFHIFSLHFSRAEPNTFILWWKTLCMMILFNNGNHTEFLLDASKLLHTWAHCSKITSLYRRTTIWLLFIWILPRKICKLMRKLLFSRESRRTPGENPLCVCVCVCCGTLIGCHLPIGCCHLKIFRSSKKYAKILSLKPQFGDAIFALPFSRSNLDIDSIDI